jgi:GNAT superfamily N-acetyltransferase
MTDCDISRIRLVQPQTASDWSLYYDLRWRVLRAPWNQLRGSERDALEPDSVHLMALDPSGKPVGVGRLHLNSPTEAQVRFMAVEEHCRRTGVGTAILHALEDRARALGATSVVLEARDPAVPFYSRHGYELLGSGKTLFGSVPHRRMRKVLAGVSGLA